VEQLYFVKSGTLELLDKENRIVAVYGPRSVLGMSEMVAGEKISGMVIAQRPASVVAIEKSTILSDLTDANSEIMAMIGGVVDTVGRRAVKA
jgi:CRP-like cAMP-binding protein